LTRKVQTRNSVSAIVREIVSNDIFINTAIRNDYANLSSVTRILRPYVAERFGTDFSENAILSALKRFVSYKMSYEQDIFDVLANSTLQLSSGIVKVVTRTSSLKHITEIFASFPLLDSIYFSVGADYITIVLEEEKLQILKSLRAYEIVDSKNKLGIISIRSTTKMLRTPGFLMYVYEKLASNGVNVEETTNSYTDTIIVVDEKQLDLSFHALIKLIEYAKMRVGFH